MFVSITMSLQKCIHMITIEQVLTHTTPIPKIFKLIDLL